MRRAVSPSEIADRSDAQGAEAIPIVYVAGDAPSTSTRLGILLSQLPSTFAVGEFRRLWESGLALL